MPLFCPGNWDVFTDSGGADVSVRAGIDSDLNRSVDISWTLEKQTMLNSKRSAVTFDWDTVA